MKATRGILFVSLLALFNFNGSAAGASVTKVGNGDDGADLEALTPITSGPIFDARAHAVALLKKVNAAGIAGLGGLLPETDRAELFMAAQDVHPTSDKKDSLEISEDKRFVYARTFAEPYAATRFFPAAQKLSSEQLVALHIHEALHRALPAGIREDENIVMHLTLAITSPGAHYDRVRQVASLYMKDLGTGNSSVGILATSSSKEDSFTAPPSSKTKFSYEQSFHNDKTGTPQVYGLEVETALSNYKKVADYIVEPVFRGRMKVQKHEKLSSLSGPVSLELQGRLRPDEEILMGPFARLTTKTFDDSSSLGKEREVTTLGFFYKKSALRSYIDLNLGYSFGSETTDGSTYKPITSLVGHSGFQWGRFRLGGLFEMHSSGGYRAKETYYDSYSDDSSAYTYYRDSGFFRLLLVGPELAYEMRQLQIKVSYKTLISESSSDPDLSDLADVMDHGLGRDAVSVSFAYIF